MATDPLKIDNAFLGEQLNRLDSPRTIAFGAACCERLLPNYAVFSSEVNWGNEHALRYTLDQVWIYTNEMNLSRDQIRKMSETCEAAAPDSEDFQSLYTSFAQDAAFATCAVLDYIENRRAEKIILAASYVIDTIDLYVQEIHDMDADNPKREEAILTHPLIQRELNRRQDDLKYLLNKNLSSSELIKAIAQKWRGHSCISNM